MSSSIVTFPTRRELVPSELKVVSPTLFELVPSELNVMFPTRWELVPSEQKVKLFTSLQITSADTPIANPAIAHPTTIISRFMAHPFKLRLQGVIVSVKTGRRRR
jgi:hypothetical protein